MFSKVSIPVYQLSAVRNFLVQTPAGGLVPGFLFAEWQQVLRLYYSVLLHFDRR